MRGKGSREFSVEKQLVRLPVNRQRRGGAPFRRGSLFGQGREQEQAPMVGKFWLERQVCEGNQQAVFLLVCSAQLLFLQEGLWE